MMLMHSKKEVKLMPFVSEKSANRFWSKVALTAEVNCCWEWQGCKNRSGYGMIKFYDHTYLAHRLSFYLYYKQDPLDKQVCHRCQNKSCVNPTHFFLGTTQENHEDSVVFGTAVIAKGEKHYAAKLTADQVILITEEYAKGKTTHEELAKKYGVTRRHVGDIVCGNTWTHISSQMADNPNRKIRLTEEQVSSIIQEYSKGDITQRLLSVKYNVKNPTIHSIVRGKSWKHLQSKKETA